MSELSLILASGSPRRRELLTAMGVDFAVHVTNTDERRRPNESPQEYVSRLARDKAQVASIDLQKTSLAILAADTIVVQGDDVFEKPQDFADAQRIWKRLSNAKHQVMTAVCLKLHASITARLCCTDVEFGPINDTQMQAYWASGEPKDKAGAYAIQGLASAWVKLLHGSYSNVVGLPLREVNELLTPINRNWL